MLDVSAEVTFVYAVVWEVFGGSDSVACFPFGVGLCFVGELKVRHFWVILSL